MNERSVTGRILIVDDQPQNLRLLSQALTDNGFEVRGADSGKLALDFVQKEVPDLLLLDIRMPDLDGFEVCSRLKTDPRTRDIPVIFLSALTDAVDKVKGLKLGAVDYVTKPVDTAELLARVRTHLALHYLDMQLREVNRTLELRVAERTRELVAANEELTNSERKYRILFELAAVGVAQIDAHTGKFVKVNQKYCDIVGYSMDEIERLDFQSITYPEDISADLIKKELLNAETITEFTNEKRYVRKDGQIIWVQLTVSSMWEKGAEPDFHIAVVADITERKQAQEKLADRNRFIESLMNLSPDILYIYDLIERKNIYVNDGIRKLLGYSIEEVEAMSDRIWQILIHPDDLKTYLDQTIPRLQKAKNGELIKSLLRMRHHSGQWRWLEISDVVYLRTIDGSPRQIFGVAHDLTDVKQAQESLYRLNRDLRALSNCNQVLVRADNEQALLDEICRIICEDAGYPMAWVGFLDPDRNGFVRRIALGGKETLCPQELSAAGPMQDFWQEPVHFALQSKRTFTIDDYAHDSIDSSWRDCALKIGYKSAVVLLLTDGKEGIFGTLSIYSSEANIFTPGEVRLLEELAGDLSYGICNLRSRIERKRTEKNLEIALREKETLLQELYHRTKNNMGVIASFLEMQGMLSDDENLKRIVQEMKNRIRAMALVHEMLYESKNLSMINLGDYLSKLGDLLLKSYIALTGRVDFHVDTTSVPVTIDIAVPCCLVVTELLSNSCKYAFPADRRGTIELRLRRCGENEAELVLCDDGIGKGKTFDVKQLRSLGIPMTVAIVQRQLHGSMDLDTSKGFCWRIQFRTDIYRERV